MAKNGDYRTYELMAVEVARHLRDEEVCFIGIGSPRSKAELAKVMSESANPMMLTPWQRQDDYSFIYAPVAGMAIRYDRNFRRSESNDHGTVYTFCTNKGFRRGDRK